MRLPYSEGTVFLVPLRNGGFARGLVARSGPQGKVLLGYFFGPRLASESDGEIEGLDINQATICLRFGDLGLIKGEWPILGSLDPWDRSSWPMPRFVRHDPSGRLKPRVLEYSDNDPNKLLSETVVEDGQGYLPDALSGYAAVSIKLDNLLKTD